MSNLHAARGRKRGGWHRACVVHGRHSSVYFPWTKPLSAHHESVPTAGPPSGEALICNYPGNPGGYDEMLDAAGGLRPHWRWFLDAMDPMGDRAIAQLQRQTDGMLRENGVTYNVYGDPRGMDRPWSLDVLPVLVSASDWAVVDAGMKQRCRLLNKIAADLYGPQRLLRDRIVPPEIIYANPSFLRACRGIAPSRFGHIPRYAADLVRAPDGGWVVRGDRVQAASGTGYAMENRTVLSQTFPRLLAEGRIRRMSDYFAHFREMLFAMAPAGRDDARVALWTPGPMNEVYFEHVYLAKHLGFPLVEGGDLTVRDNRVFLKTIEGLQAVDVIVLRVDDAFCDPLELRRDSSLGVVGLLHATRFGHVAMCNAIGSAALEAPAIATMLPRLCRHLLSEDLLLRSAATHWGGDPEHRAWIDGAFDQVRLARAFGHSSERPVAPGELSQEARDDLRARWAARPHEYVAIDTPAPSTVPVWTAKGLEPRNLTLRAFAVGGDRSAHIQVMPGGLARYNESGDALGFTMQRGGGSKDVWILSETATEFRNAPELERGAPVICRSPANLSSRLAENLMWFGRYCERTEYAVRFLRHLIARCTDEEESIQPAELGRLVDAAPHLFNHSFRDEIARRAGARENVGIPSGRLQESIVESVYDADNPDSIFNDIQAIRRTAWTVRERFSDDDWRIVNGFSYEFLEYQRLKGLPGLGATLYALNQLVKGFAAFSGLVHENMTREPGQIFLEIGRRVERASVTARLLSRICFAPQELGGRLLRDMLAICDSPMTYRARYGQHVYLATVLDLVLCDETNPRSVAFQIQALVALLAQLPDAGTAGLLRPEERVVERLRTLLRVNDARELCAANATGQCPALAPLLDSLNADLQQLADLLGRRYFIHTSAPRQLDAEAGPAPR